MKLLWWFSGYYTARVVILLFFGVSSLTRFRHAGEGAESATLFSLQRSISWTWLLHQLPTAAHSSEGCNNGQLGSLLRPLSCFSSQ